MRNRWIGNLIVVVAAALLATVTTKLKADVPEHCDPAFYADQGNAAPFGRLFMCAYSSDSLLSDTTYVDDTSSYVETGQARGYTLAFKCTLFDRFTCTNAELDSVGYTIFVQNAINDTDWATTDTVGPITDTLFHTEPLSYKSYDNTRIIAQIARPTYFVQDTSLNGIDNAYWRRLDWQLSRFYYPDH